MDEREQLIEVMAESLAKINGFASVPDNYRMYVGEMMDAALASGLVVLTAECEQVGLAAGAALGDLLLAVKAWVTADANDIYDRQTARVGLHQAWDAFTDESIDTAASRVALPQPTGGEET